jgi:hypothetical protein
VVEDIIIIIFFFTLIKSFSEPEWFVSGYIVVGFMCVYDLYTTVYIYTCTYAVVELILPEKTLFFFPLKTEI